MLDEHTFRCPYCGERVSCLLDGSAGAQEYVEDCEVCCRPMLVSTDFDDDGRVSRFSVRRLDE